jgi:hypothetical protein
MRAGLCGVCRHRRLIRSGRGSAFLLCLRSKTDPRFRRYPSLPVFHCFGFEPGEPDLDTPNPGAGGEDQG